MWTRFPFPNIFGKFRKISRKFYEEMTDTGGNVVDTSTT